jgi:exodeoxyribonuclease-1
LTAANGISHADAHDALADVYATIALAQRVKTEQPRLFEFVLSHRGKAEATSILNLGSFEPVVHVSSRFGAERNCLAIVVAIAMHPSNRNAVITYDLGTDPELMLELDVVGLRERVFTAAAELGEGRPRVPLKLVHLNKAPVLAPLKVLRAEDWIRLGLDRGLILSRLERLRGCPGLARKLADVFEPSTATAVPDPEAALYSGGFIGSDDRAALEHLQTLPVADWSACPARFADARLPELVFRFRARNYPECLDAEEIRRWEAFRLARLNGHAGAGPRSIHAFRSELDAIEAKCRGDGRAEALLRELRDYGEKLLTRNQDGFPYT